MPLHPRTSRTQPRVEELAFLQAIVNSPGDDALWLILSDWLLEHDDPRRAELLRLHRQLLATCCEPETFPQRASGQARLVQLLAGGVNPSVPRQSVILGEGIEMTFTWIPPGSFLMGSPPDEAERGEGETRHQVTLAEGFWLGVTPVTQTQWQMVMRENPSRNPGDDLPVDQVSWTDCQGFCRRLGKKLGTRFRLPTEAEWEYACRAGTTTPFFFGETLTGDQANFDDDDGPPGMRVYREGPTPVASFSANAWGLYDMHGNVYEWCKAWHDEAGSAATPKAGSQGRDREKAGVLRGGSWFGYRRWCRSSCRVGMAPTSRLIHAGCRVVLCPD
jgi:uncharacterized protein (TIGR02996 family)